MWLCTHNKIQYHWPIFQSDKVFRFLIWNNFFPSYVKQGLVASVRGPGGGYRLGADAHTIAIGTVIAAVDESVDATKCNGRGDCQGGTRCLTHTLWRDLSSRISDFLNNITLGELMT